MVIKHISFSYVRQCTIVVDELLTSADISSSEDMTMLHFLVGMWMSAYLISNEKIVQWCSAKMTALTVMRGNSEFAAFAYVQYAYLCILRSNEFETGYQYGALAVELSHRYDNNEMLGKVYFNFAIFINHWTHHVST